MGSVAAHGRAQHGGTAHAAPQLRVVTWNIAAINNNPFEYWCARPSADTPCPSWALTPRPGAGLRAGSRTRTRRTTA